MGETRVGLFLSYSYALKHTGFRNMAVLVPDKIVKPTT
jgi:hypothetical protein